MMRTLSRAKTLIVPLGTRPRRVRFGVYRGLTLDLDLVTQTQVLLGLYERETFPWLRTAVSRCEWAIDVGAGRGELCLLLLKSARLRRLYAFEPQASEAGWLTRNLELNGRLGDRRLTVLRQFAGPAVRGNAAPLDSLELDRTRRGFLKIDVDGPELDVLRSGERLLREARMDVLIETHSEALERDCLAFLRAEGYWCEVIPNARWRVLLPELRPIAHNRWLWATKDKGVAAKKRAHVLP